MAELASAASALPQPPIPALPATMRAVVCHGPGEVVVRIEAIKVVLVP